MVTFWLARHWKMKLAGNVRPFTRTSQTAGGTFNDGSFKEEMQTHAKHNYFQAFPAIAVCSLPDYHLLVSWLSKLSQTECDFVGGEPFWHPTVTSILTKGDKKAFEHIKHLIRRRFWFITVCKMMNSIHLIIFLRGGNSPECELWNAECYGSLLAGQQRLNKKRASEAMSVQKSQLFSRAFVTAM